MDNGFRDPRSKGEDRKRREDIKFLDKVRSSDTRELFLLYANHQNADTPHWKRTAIRRAIGKKLKV